MKVVILAAGLGSRMESYRKDLPKCIIPLNDNNDTTLSILISSLKSSNITDILIIGGYKFQKLKNYIQTQFNSQIHSKNLNIKLIDSRPLNKKGSLFSLLSGMKFFEKEDMITVLPADTIFHPNLIKGILKLLIPHVDPQYNHIFYSKFKNFPVYGRSTLIYKTVNSVEYVKSIFQIPKNSLKISDDLDFFDIMIPILVISNKSYAILNDFSKNGQFSLVSAINIIMKENDSFLGHKILSRFCIFKDLDYAADLPIINKRILTKL